MRTVQNKLIDLAPDRYRETLRMRNRKQNLFALRYGRFVLEVVMTIFLGALLAGSLLWIALRLNEMGVFSVGD